MAFKDTYDQALEHGLQWIAVFQDTWDADDPDHGFYYIAFSETPDFLAHLSKPLPQGTAPTDRFCSVVAVADPKTTIPAREWLKKFASDYKHPDGAAFMID